MAKLTGASYAKIALIIAFGALAIAALGFGGCAAGCRSLGGETNMGSASVDASSVKNLSISWAAGEVNVFVVDGGDAIELSETGPRGLTKAQQMRWGVSGDTLSIDYGSWFSCFMLGRKDLEVRIPRSYADDLGLVRMDAASGTYRLDGFGCAELKVDLASGQLDATDVTAKELSLDVASGQASVAGSFADRVTLRTASGQTRVACAGACPRELAADVASGSVAVVLPEGSGFAAHVDKASGSFLCAFPTTQDGGRFVCGDGAGKIDVKLASGEFKIEQG